MEESNTWIVCKHVMNGSAKEVKVPHEKVCFCIDCAEDPTMMETMDICVLDEPLLEERLKKLGPAAKLKT